MDLIEPFCTGPGVFIFQLAVNYFSDDPNDDNARIPNIRTKLLIDDVEVALSFIFDQSEPGNTSLFYEAVLTEESKI